MLLTFLISCLFDIIDNCKSPVDIISETRWFVFNNKASSQYSPDRNVLLFELTPETTFVEVQEGNSRKIELRDLS